MNIEPGDLVCSKSAFISICDPISGFYLDQRLVNDEVLLCIGVFMIDSTTFHRNRILVMRETGELVASYIDNVFSI